MTVPSAAKDRTPTTGEAGAGRLGLASPATALILGGLVLALLVAQVPLGDMAHQLDLSVAASTVTALALAGVGLVVAWRQPRNPMGWILLAGAVFVGFNNDASLYTVLVYRLGHQLPLGAVAVLLQPSWAPGIVLFGLAILLFPEGRVPSPRWRWVLVAYLMSGAAIAMLSGLFAFTQSGSRGILHTVSVVAFAGLAALPVSIGIGILKYRLFDIDRLISRTLAYAVVTGLLVGVYAGLVLLATRVLSVHSEVAVAASTLAAAALFAPVRRRVQRAVDRRFNQARYDADRTVAAFSARLKDAVDLDSVRDDLAGVVQTALEPAHVSVWIRGGGR